MEAVKGEQTLAGIFRSWSKRTAGRWI